MLDRANVTYLGLTEQVQYDKRVSDSILLIKVHLSLNVHY